MQGNHLILDSVAEWGSKNKKETLYLGGGGGIYGEGLMIFKQRFAKNGIRDYYIGTKIRNEEIYRQAVKIAGVENGEYFPLYRRRK